MASDDEGCEVAFDSVFVVDESGLGPFAHHGDVPGLFEPLDLVVVGSFLALDVEDASEALNEFEEFFLIEHDSCEGFAAGEGEFLDVRGRHLVSPGGTRGGAAWPLPFPVSGAVSPLISVVRGYRYLLHWCLVI